MLKKYKIGIVASLIGATVLGLAFGGIKVMNEQKVEEKLYTYSGITGPKGSDFEGMSLKFEQENINCSGFMAFSCEVKDVFIELPSIKRTVGKIETVYVGDLTKNGFEQNRQINSYLNLENVELFDINNSISTESGKRLKEMLSPFSIEIHMNAKMFKPGERKGYILAKYSSDVGSINFRGDFYSYPSSKPTYIDKNMSITRNELIAVAERQNPAGIRTVLQNFEVVIEDKNISEALYHAYSFYYDAYKTEKEQTFFNINVIGYGKAKKVSYERFNKELSDRLSSMVIHYENNKEMRDYLSKMDKLIFHKGYKKFSLVGKNRADFSVEELSVLNELDQLTQDQSKYFEITTEVIGGK